MKKNRATVGLLILASALLGACNSSVSDQPITGDHPAPPADSTATTAAPLDSTAAVSEPVPFVNSTKVGRTLGDQSPSPPASRTR